MVLLKQLRAIGDGKGGPGEQGFTLIEIMFAAVYLATGLLAIAAMQDIALSRNVDAKRISIATNLAVEMLERVRYNSPNNSTSVTGVGYPYHKLVACNYACTSSQIQAACSLCTGVSASSAGNATVNATALGDYNQWLARLSAADATGQTLLPSAVGTVTSTATGTADLGQVLVTVTVQWTSGLRTPTINMHTIVAPL
jgi:type IV pilus modification protein PilV